VEEAEAMVPGTRRGLALQILVSIFEEVQEDAVQLKVEDSGEREKELGNYPKKNLRINGEATVLQIHDVWLDTELSLHSRTNPKPQEE
jgi:hypothetical protein